MVRSTNNPDQLTLFDSSQYEPLITEASIDCAGYEPKSSPVPREIVQRENFLGLEVGQVFTFSLEGCDAVDRIIYQTVAGQQATIENLDYLGGWVEFGFECGVKLRLKPIELVRYLKSSPVPRVSVQRENFQWVEEYLVRRRYLYHRYCYLRCTDTIEQVVKIHIPAKPTGRVQLVKEAIAAGLPPSSIEEMIRQW